MGFIQLIVLLAVLGLIVWAIKTLIPMEPAFSKAITVVAVIIAVLIVLSAFGLLPIGLGSVAIRPLH